MKAKSDSNSICGTCGAVIPEEAPAGLCPACVLAASQTETIATGAPSVDQIAAAFPELDVVGMIGRGGMGAVYHARQPKLDRDLALKILLPDLGADPAFEERFTREAQALAKLNHSNIVSVYDFGERDGLFYLTMEFVDGVNLRQAMAAGRFTPEQALAVVPGVCDALAEAHEMDILHRDIKPENILLDKSGRVKIVDFGIARMVGAVAPNYTLTQTGAVMGSPQYMAPEQLERTHDVDHRADIYSLGVVLYEMLTGELPIGRFRPPSEKSGTTRDIDAVVMRALEKELDRRFQNVTEVKTQVQGAETKRSPLTETRSATEDAGTKPSRAGEIAGVAKLTVWALGLTFLGATLTGMGFAWRGLELNELETAVVFLGIILLWTVGYCGCCLALRAIRREEISSAGQSLLRLVVILLPSLFVAYLMATWLSVGLKDFGKGCVFLTMIFASIPTYLLSRALAGPLGFRIGAPGARARAWCGIVVLIAGTALWAASQDGRWPMDHSKILGVVNLPSIRDHPIEPAVERAVGERDGVYAISNEADRVEILVLHQERSASAVRALFEQLVRNLSQRIKPTNESETAVEHIKAFKQRLLDALPATAIEGAELQISRVPSSAQEKLFTFGLMASMAAAAMGLMGAPSGTLGMCAMIFAYSVMLLVPAQPYPQNGPQLVDGPAMAELEQEIMEVDLSTPEAAAITYVRALASGNLEVARRIIPLADYEKLMKQRAGVGDGAILKSTFSDKRVLGVSRYGQTTNAGVGVSVELVSRDGKRRSTYQNWFVESPLGDWMIAAE